MALEYRCNFNDSIIECSGVNVPKENNCHLFSLKAEVSWSSSLTPLLPGKSIRKNKKWLYGPAVCLVTRSVIYPCAHYRCSVPCPCHICQKKHPRCRIPSSQPCNCKDCVEHFENHTVFHATYHFGCKFCFQIVKCIPNFNFVVLSSENKKYNGISIIHTGLGPRPDPNLPLDFVTGKVSASEIGFECNSCGLPYNSLADLKDHILMNHVHCVSKLFRHSYKSIKKQRRSY